MEKVATNQSSRNYGLDLLRIFAMLSVVWVHLSIYLPVSDAVRPLFTWGANGVYIFFTLSGFLATKSFQNNLSTKEYYMKRAIRILPSYYVGIILMIIITYVITGGEYSDIFHLGWLRYFLGLNTVLPSNNYDIWNNRYGYWTMSCFIWFYILAPLIFKFVKSFKSSIVFIGASFGIFAFWKVAVDFIFSRIEGIENLSVTSGGSPFATLYYFAFGIMIYFAVKEGKALIACGISLLFGIAGILIERNSWAWCAITCIIIAIFSLHKLDIKSQTVSRFVKWLSGQSFYIYLAHMMAFNLSLFIVDKFDSLTGSIKYVAWGGYCNFARLCDCRMYEFG
ncbi:MAG: acyltransferase [Oscillospiraceae bacterium]|nr:acyltransferase [Oscillospiraceae bacterium]